MSLSGGSTRDHQVISKIHATCIITTFHMGTSGDGRLLDDCLKSGGRFIGLDILLPFLAYTVAVGALSVIGIQFKTIVSYLPQIILVLIALLIAGFVITYWGELLGIGILLTGLAIVGALFIFGIQALLGSVGERLSELLVGGFSAIVWLVVVLLLLTLFLGVVGTLAFTVWIGLYFLTVLYGDINIKPPSLWVLPPIIAGTAIGAQATISGSLESVALVILFLTVSSFTVRSGLYASYHIQGSDSVWPGVPIWTFSGAISLSVFTWGFRLDDPNRIQALVPYLQFYYGMVEQITPFTLGDNVAAVSVLIPSMIVSAVVVAVHVPYSELSINTGSSGTAKSGSTSSSQSTGGSLSTQSSPNDTVSGSSSRETTVNQAEESRSDTEVYDPDDFDDGSGDTKIFKPDE